jgi:hypothetical protein
MAETALFQYQYLACASKDTLSMAWLVLHKIPRDYRLHYRPLVTNELLSPGVDLSKSYPPPWDSKEPKQTPLFHKSITHDDS